MFNVGQERRLPRVT